MIKGVRVQNFRKHSDYSIEFKHNKNIILGPNGSGKTSLIEAIYIAHTGKTWRSSMDDITNINKTWWRADIKYDDNQSRIVKYSNNESNYIINDMNFKRLPNKYKMSVILFEPNDLNLLYGSPSHRRNFLDKFISSLDIEYSRLISSYNRILKQRNILLKKSSSKNNLFVWDIQFADVASNIIIKRKEFIEKINKLLPTEYQKIDNHKTNLVIEYPYYSSNINAIRQNILNELHDNYYNEITFGHTSVGPHKHDIFFSLNKKEASSMVSRGENRSIILAIKNVEYSFKKEYSPVILLDDVLSEFDEKHQTNLLHNYSDNQIIITGVKAPTTTHGFNKIEI